MSPTEIQCHRLSTLPLVWRSRSCYACELTLEEECSNSEPGDPFLGRLRRGQGRVQACEQDVSPPTACGPPASAPCWPNRCRAAAGCAYRVPPPTPQFCCR